MSKQNNNDIKISDISNTQTTLLNGEIKTKTDTDEDADSEASYGNTKAVSNGAAPNAKPTWTLDIDCYLKHLMDNSLLLSKKHKSQFFRYQSFLKYFRVPIIVLSAVNSIVSVGLQPYWQQTTISLLCCFISMVCGIITSVELYLAIENNMTHELSSSKSFYQLYLTIYRTLQLRPEHRGDKCGLVFLDEQYSTYGKLIDNSNLLFSDEQHLAPIFVAGCSSARPQTLAAAAGVANSTSRQCAQLYPLFQIATPHHRLCDPTHFTPLSKTEVNDGGDCVDII